LGVDFLHWLSVVSLHRSNSSLLLLEADAAQHRPALRWFERNRRGLAALRTVRSGLRANPGTSAHTFRLALFAVLGVIFELFVVKE
jgi:hypothetical protein